MTMGGKTFDFWSGAAIVSPPAIEARDSITALWMTMLPAVRAVISRPSRIDTPDEMSVPRVRVKRDTADFRSRSPSTGRLSISLSIWSFPGVVLEYRFTATKPKIRTAMIVNQKFLRTLLAPMTMGVGRGSARLTDANMLWNVGITKISSTAIAMPATEKITAG